MALDPKPMCVMCGAAVHDRGEDTLPNWFLRRYQDATRVIFEHQGEPILNRSGMPRAIDHVPRFLLPVCQACNGKLNDRYENPLRAPVRAVMDEGHRLCSSHEVEGFARWWLKTVLLVKHPSTRVVVDGAPDRAGLALELSQDTYRGVRDGLFPPDLSLWLTRWSNDSDHRLTEPRRIYLLSTSETAPRGRSSRFPERWNALRTHRDLSDRVPPSV